MKNSSGGTKKHRRVIVLSAQFERCGRRKWTETLRWNTILIFGMLRGFSTQRSEIPLPTLITLHQGQPWAQPGSQWRLTLAPPAFSSGSTFPFWWCTCHWLPKKQIPRRQAELLNQNICEWGPGICILTTCLTPTLMIFFTLSFKNHWANNHASLPQIYVSLLPDKPALLKRRWQWWLTTSALQWYRKSFSWFQDRVLPPSLLECWAFGAELRRVILKSIKYEIF